MNFSNLQGCTTIYTTGSVVLVAYLCLVRLLRYKRAAKTEAKFGHARDISTMSYTEAFEIMRDLQELEFPSSFRLALALALIKTAGIPTISNLLLATGQLSEKNAPRRASDTEVLMTEMQNSHPDSTRHLQAIARVNFLHARYRKAGKILNEDMVHTLGDAMTEMFRVVDTHEWRKLTNVERCAISLFHKNFGEALEIDFSVLLSSVKGWENGLYFAEVPIRGALQYPEGLPAICAGEAVSGDGQVMRESMGLPEPTPMSRWAGATLRSTMKVFFRYLVVPRPEFLAVKNITQQPDPQTGLYGWHHYMAEPWYVRPSLLQRWGPRGTFIRLFGSATVPGQDGKFQPEGYDIRTVGPPAQEGKGSPEMDAMIERWKMQGRGGCPFHSPQPPQ